MAKKRAKWADSRLHVVCPFCKSLVHPGWPSAQTAYRWCSGCYTEFYFTRAGNVTFDTELQTPEFAWAKAIARAGGVRFGDV